LKIWIKFFTWGLLKRVATGNVWLGISQYS
jgi:hypothetical protein